MTRRTPKGIDLVLKNGSERSQRALDAVREAGIPLDYVRVRQVDSYNGRGYKGPVLSIAGHELWGVEDIRAKAEAYYNIFSYPEPSA